MKFSFTPEQRAFQTTVRDLLEKECSPAQVRAAWEDPTGFSPERWRALRHLGVVNLTAPEPAGLGMNDVDMILLSEEAGRACLPEPLLEHTAVALPLLRAHAPHLIPEPDQVVTTGIEHRTLVASANVATTLLLTRGNEVHAIPARDARLTPQPSMDRGRRLFTVEWTPAARSLVTADPQAIEDAFDRGALHAAAQLVGVGAKAIEMAAEYALQRKQFGVAIGSFQAVKHLLANALVGIEFARPLVYRAAWSMSEGVAERSTHVSMAKAAASDAAVAALRAALQVHGAIGYTKECDLHLWLARGFALSTAWGDAARHRSRVEAAVFSPER